MSSRKNKRKSDSLRVVFGGNKELEGLWRDEALCDIELKARDGYSAKCHKIILASVSPFFKALFTGAGTKMSEASTTEIELNGVTGEGLKILLSAIYTNSLQLTDDNLKTTLEASNVLEVSWVRDLCCEYMQEHLDRENCLEVLKLAETCSLDQLYQDTLSFVCSHLTELAFHQELYQMTQGISKVTILKICDYLHRSMGSERDLLFFVLEWMKSTLCSSVDDACEIWSQIQIEPDVIESEARRFGLDHLLCSLPPLKYMCPSIPLNTGCMKPETHILIAGGHDASWRSFRNTYKYDPINEKWMNGSAMPASFSFTAAASISTYAYFVGGNMYSAKVSRYNKWKEEWSSCPSFEVARNHPAVVSLGHHLYVCGGRRDYGNSSNCTEILAHQLPVDEEWKWIQGPNLEFERFSFGATCLGADIYAVGGQTARSTHDSIEVLKQGAGRWTLLEARLSTVRKYLSVVAVAGRIYAIGGMNAQRIRLSTVEAYDPREGRWQPVVNLSVPRSSCGAVVFKEKLYVMGGNSNDTSIHASMECYIPQSGIWLSCLDMKEERSGLAAVVV